MPARPFARPIRRHRFSAHFRAARRSSVRGLIFVSALVLVLSGCVVGPNFKTPPAPTQTAYNAGSLPHRTASTAGPDGAAQVFDRGQQVRADWYRLLGSKALDQLIQQALAHNPTLTAAQARLAAAREAVTAAIGTGTPQLGLSADASRNRASGASFGISNPEFVNTFNQYQAQLTASYDLDPFGALARQVESRKAQVEVQRYRLLDSRMTLVDNVVASALAEAGARATLAATQDIVATQRKALHLIQQRQRYGAAQRSDVLRAQAELSDTEATLPALQQQIAVARHRLALLTGQSPADYRAPALNLDDFTLPTQLPVSLPSQLVRQRPDLLAAASVMHVELARVGVASARLLPDITLSASYGRIGLHPSDLLDPPAAIWNFGAGLMAPLLDGGTLHANKRAAQDQYRATVADYRYAVLHAFDQVADALRALDNDAQALRARQQSLQASGQALKLVQARYRAGSADFLNLYQTQELQRRSAIRYTQARLQRYQDTATLFRALGGGWWNAPHPASDHASDQNPDHSSNVATTTPIQTGH